MHDAAELCDRVAFIVDGKIKRMDTPHNLIRKMDYAKIVYAYLEDGIEKQREVLKSETSMCQIKYLDMDNQVSLTESYIVLM